MSYKFIKRINKGKTVSKRKSSGTTILMTIMIIFFVFTAVGIMFYYGEKEPVVIISDNLIRIEAMYGINIDFADINDISLIEKSMNDIGPGRRTNGYGGFGETLKGHFDSEKLGEILLFVKSKTSPTMLIECNGSEDIYISFGDEEKTKSLYQELIAAIS